MSRGRESKLKIGIFREKRQNWAIFTPRQEIMKLITLQPQLHYIGEPIYLNMRYAG